MRERAWEGSPQLSVGFTLDNLVTPFIRSGAPMLHEKPTYAPTTNLPFATIFLENALNANTELLRNVSCSSSMENAAKVLCLYLGKKDAELRQKQREIDLLYGKLAAGSQLADPELRSALTAALKRLADQEELPTAIEGKGQQ